MKLLNNSKKTRFKIAIFVLIFLMGVTVYSIYKEAYTLAGTSLAAVLTVASSYILGDSYRKS
jgi:uncharacterized membrane protein